MSTFRKSVRTLAAALAVGAAAWSAAPAVAQVSPEESLKSLKVPDGLELTLFAAEPALVNPTNIDVDAKGRVWVLEAANYRGSKTRPEGDRILILEDTDKDGKADKTTVFYQDPSLFSPLGIHVMGDKVYVAQSPNLWVFTVDETGDKPKGKPEVLFTNFSGVNHDHGLHAGVFGPDGRYYFNAGNDGSNTLVKHGDGSPVVDSTGSEVGAKGTVFRGKPKEKGAVGYQEGMAFRCDLDGKNFDTLGFNFRNNYELTVDSFGTVWQSDNDDDGNQSVRINYVMEGGNFGFKGPKGTAWGRDQQVVPGQTRQQAHWHLNWPGVVPNLLHTGGGSPTGITIYEGSLLPEKYKGAILHCDAGPNVVRAYMVAPSSFAPTGLMAGEKSKDAGAKAAEAPSNPAPGAGYQVTEVVDLIKGADKWFRPSDVCVAPDGSVLVADWYDPGVGGHATGDPKTEKNQPRDWKQMRGRIYRVAPTGSKYAVPALDLSSVKGQVEALGNPNFAVRYLAWNKLHTGGAEAAKALEDVFANSKEPRQRARALWLLARGEGGKAHVERALADKDADIRVTALRAARLIKMDVPAIADRLAADESPIVRREVAISLNTVPAEKAVPILVKLADKYDGKDRWYLEALGIGATGKEEAFLAAWQKDGKNKDAEAERMLNWRMKREAPLGAPPGAARAPAADEPQAAAVGTDGGALRPFDFAGGTGNVVDGSADALAADLCVTTDAAVAAEGQPAPAAPAAQQPAPSAPAAAPAVTKDPAPAAGATTAPAALPEQVFKDAAGKVYPPMDKLAALPGDATAGAALFRDARLACNRCHQVGDEGGMVGPPLTTIGDKLSRQQLAESIFYPSAAILMEYENWIVKTKDDEVYTGRKVEETEDHVTILDGAGAYHDVKLENLKSKRMDKQSMMPEGLHAAVTQQEMANLLAYLASLKNQ